MTPQITWASALPGKTGNEKHENCIFFTRCSALPEFNQSLIDFFNFFDSRLILTLLYDSLNLNQCVRFGDFGGIVQKKRSRERCSNWTVLQAQTTSALTSGFPRHHPNREPWKRYFFCHEGKN